MAELLIQVVPQLPAAAWMAQFSEGLCLDLADTLSCDVKLFSYFLECAGAPVVHAEAQAENLLFSLCQCIQHFVKLFF